MLVKVRSLALSSLFGIVIFSQKFWLPYPYDKYVSVLPQIVLLSLAFLVVGFTGPVLTGFISGLLTASMRGELWFITFPVALIYGVLVSTLNRLFGVVGPGQVRRKRLMASSLISTLLVGFLSAGSFIILGVMPYNPFLVSTIIAAGAVQGLVGGYVSGVIWERYLRNV